MRNKLFVILLIMALLVFSGCESEPDYEAYCDSCNGGILDECSITAFEYRTLCPYCANMQIYDLINGEDGLCSECDHIYDAKYLGQYGMCTYCELDLLDFCSVCGEAMLPWNCDSELRLCPRCLGKAMNDETFARAIENWWYNY